MVTKPKLKQKKNKVSQKKKIKRSKKIALGGKKKLILKHIVNVPAAGYTFNTLVLDIGKERFSMPYFMSPKHSARISPMHLQSNRESCEDASYEKDQANKKEMDQLISFG